MIIKNGHADTASLLQRGLVVGALLLALSGCSIDADSTDVADTGSSGIKVTSAPPFTLDKVDDWTLLCDLPTNTSSNLYGIAISGAGTTLELTAQGSVDLASQDSALTLDNVRCILLELGIGEDGLQQFQSTPTPASMSFNGYDLAWRVEGGGSRLEATVTVHSA